MATAFVYWRERLLLHRHPKLDMWLPCGGHVEPGETPEEAAVREVLEESGVAVELVGERALEVAEPLQLLRPRGVQLEHIGPGHEHIDFVYFARPLEPYDGTLGGTEPGLAWFTRKELDSLPLTEEMQAWTELALSELHQPRTVRRARALLPGSA
ncbi:MAG: NUDIX domain-containing protein [Trueperaceae bacterium]